MCAVNCGMDENVAFPDVACRVSGAKLRRRVAFSSGPRERIYGLAAVSRMDKPLKRIQIANKKKGKLARWAAGKNNMAPEAKRPNPSRTPDL